jgi:hypothetical protein
MLEEAEIALARAELRVIEARGRFSDQLATIDRLKSRGEDALEAKQTLGLFEAYLFIMERHRDFLLRSQRPSEAKWPWYDRSEPATVIVNAKR